MRVKRDFLSWRNRLRLGLFLLIFVSSCVSPSTTESWLQQYKHLQKPLPEDGDITEADYYIVFLVAALHLDYMDNRALAKTLITHSHPLKNGPVGHSWVYLKGWKDGEPFLLEGGQSGQRGKEQPRFHDGVMNYMNYGYSNPTLAQKGHPRYEPNPIKYLWANLNDGFFQGGSGGHRPTFAAKVDLTEEQFQRILAFLDPKNPAYQRFSLVGRQCSSFVAQIASMASFPIEHKVTVHIEPELRVGFRKYRFWKNPKYSKITFSSPDVIERSLMEAVREGRAEYALDWYLNRR